MTDGRRGVTTLLAGIAVVGLCLGSRDLSAQKRDAATTLDLGSSYAEWKQDGALIVDGQRVVVTRDTKWKGKLASVEAVPLGHEVRVKGVRQATGDVLAGLQKEGFEPFMVCQSRTRIEDRREHTKHMVRLRHASQIVTNEANEIILINSHDGTSSYQMLADDGTRFDAQIPTFTLSVPRTLH